MPQSNARHKPKYEHVLEALALRIERGEYRTDTPLPTIRELMRIFGVSLATVTRALSILASRGLLRSIRGKGVFVLARRQTSALPPANGAPPAPGQAFSPVWRRLRVGVVSTYSHPHPGEMWWSRILAGIDEVVRETGNVTHVRLVRVATQAPAEVLARCGNEGVNALINLGDHWNAVQLLALHRAARARRIPVVMAWTSLPRPLPLHLVELDSLIGIEEAVNHLAELGHARIGFLGFDEPYAWVPEREQAVRVAMAARGLSPAAYAAVRQCSPTVDRSPGFDAVAGDLRARCTAVVCANDDLAAALLRWCHARQLAVPGELSIVGFDDDPQYRPLELTTVHDEMARLGREALRLLAHLNENGDGDMRLTLRIPARLVPRGTTGRPAREIQT